MQSFPLRIATRFQLLITRAGMWHVVPELAAQPHEFNFVFSCAHSFYRYRNTQASGYTDFRSHPTNVELHEAEIPPLILS